MHIKVVRYSDKYKDSLIELLGQMWKSLDEKERKERFEWRYEINPYPEEPLIFLSVDRDKVVGFRAFVVQQFVYGDRKSFFVFSPADAIVHKNYRRKGLFSKMNEVFIEYVSNLYKKNNSLILNLSSNIYSTPGYLKQGWCQTNGFKKYCYKVSLVNIIKKRIYNNSYNRSFSLRLNNKYRYEIKDELMIPDVTTFAEKYRSKTKLTNIRDEAYFKWRYLIQPEKYRFIYFYSDESVLKGYVILKRVSKVQWSLEEYLAIDIKVLKRMINKAVKLLSIPILRTRELSIDDKKTLRKCGFMSEPVWLLEMFGKRRLPVLVRPVKKEVCDEDFIVGGVDIRDINNWQIYNADVH